MKRLFIAACSILAHWALAASGSDVPNKPNILILYADDLGFGDLGCYDAKSKIPTPNLDRLASEGMRFTDAHSSSGICSPSRYALLTGRHHWRKFHRVVSSFGPSVFDPQTLTLPEMLQKVGYTTAAIGKWHLGWDWSSIRKPNAAPTQEGRQEVWRPQDYDWTQRIPDGPLAHGFDYYFGDDVINFPPYTWIENDRVLKAPDTMMRQEKWKPAKEGNWEARLGPMASGWDPYENLPITTEKGVAKIHEMAKQKQPFFLYFAFPSPHAPIIPNDEFDGKSKAGPYGDFVFQTDATCGKLLAALDEAGVTENTIVFFSADNGAEKYAYPRDLKLDHWSSGPLRGVKRDLYEGGHRVPLIIKWPGVTKGGSVSNALVSQIDLMATLAAAFKIDLPADQSVDSHDLLPLLEGNDSPVRSTHVHNTFPESYAIRHENWVLINATSGYHSPIAPEWEKKHGYSSAKGEYTVELYDLSQDLGQRVNLAAENDVLVEKLQGMLKQIMEQGYSAPRPQGN